MEGMMSDFIRSSVEKVLAGDNDELISAFIWDHSPQGHDFWYEQSKTGLTLEGRIALEQMLQQKEVDDETRSN